MPTRGPNSKENKCHVRRLLLGQPHAGKKHAAYDAVQGSTYLSLLHTYPV